MILDFAKKAQIGFQDPATPLAEGIVDLHNTIFFWLILIFTPVVIIFLRIIKRSLITWDSPTKMSILKYRRESFLFNRIIHGTLLEIIWTITPTIILIAIAIPSFGLIYAMDSINDPDWTVKVIGNQWFWTYDFNFGAMLMTDIQEIYLASTKFGQSQQGQQQFSHTYSMKMYTSMRNYEKALRMCRLVDNPTYNNYPDLAPKFKNLDCVNFLNPELKEKMLNNVNPEINEKIIARYKFSYYSYLTYVNVNPELRVKFIKMLAKHTNLVLANNTTQIKVPAYTPEMEKLVVEKTIKLWKHNVKNYLIDSYTLTENTENRNVRLLSTDNPLYVPTNRNIRVLLTSVDVLHSFAVPSLGVKLDATPGRLGAISIFIERPGQFFGQCSELCGVQHGFMSIEIYAK